MSDGSYELPKLGICSIRKFEFLLRYSRKDLRVVAARAGAFYAPFPSSPKPQPFARKTKPKKARLIENPLEPLLSIQKAINVHLLKPLPLPPHLMGGVKGKRITDSTGLHRDGKRLVKMDIASFFPSISNSHVHTIWRKHLGCSTEVARLLTQLTTVDGHLPQGAPTSTTIANLLVAFSEGEIVTFCDENAISHGTWVDDFAFSGETPAHAIPVVLRMLRRLNLRISRRKLKLYPAGANKQLHGLNVGKTPSVPRERLRQLRSGIHKLETGQVSNAEIGSYVRSLSGKIQFVSNISPGQGKKLRDLFGATLQKMQLEEHL